MLGKKVADFSAAATGGDVSSCPSTRATRSSSTSIRRTTRPAARPRARSSATCTRSSRRPARVVVGVSRDSLKSHENFKAKMDFPFELLSDADEKLCAQFGVIKMKNMYGKKVRGIERSTFVIDAQGRAGARVARRQGARPRRRKCSTSSRRSSRRGSRVRLCPSTTTAACPNAPDHNSLCSAAAALRWSRYSDTDCAEGGPWSSANFVPRPTSPRSRQDRHPPSSSCSTPTC